MPIAGFHYVLGLTPRENPRCMSVGLKKRLANQPHRPESWILERGTETNGPKYVHTAGSENNESQKSDGYM